MVMIYVLKFMGNTISILNQLISITSTPMHIKLRVSDLSSANPVANAYILKI